MLIIPLHSALQILSCRSLAPRRLTIENLRSKPCSRRVRSSAMLFGAEAMVPMYVFNDEVAKEKRAELHPKLVRIVDTIWVWAYDVALKRQQLAAQRHAVAQLKIVQNRL